MDIDRWRSRLPVTRASDGELVGWTVSEDGDESVDGYLVDAVNPVGHVVARSIPVDEASEVLEARGLASLNAPYWMRAPLPLSSDIDFRRPMDGWTWRRVVMTQLDDTRVWVRPAYPGWAERLVEVPLSIPADDVLLADTPPDSE